MSILPQVVKMLGLEMGDIFQYGAYTFRYSSHGLDQLRDGEWQLTHMTDTLLTNPGDIKIVHPGLLHKKVTKIISENPHSIVGTYEVAPNPEPFSSFGQGTLYNLDRIDIPEEKENYNVSRSAT